MKKMLFFLLFSLPVALGFSSRPDAGDCECPGVSDFRLAYQIGTTASAAWSTASGATGYKLWYFREEDNHTSSPSYTSSTSFNFTNLSSGTYTLFCQVICGEEVSEFIGTVDIEQN